MVAPPLTQEGPFFPHNAVDDKDNGQKNKLQYMN